MDIELKRLWGALLEVFPNANESDAHEVLIKLKDRNYEITSRGSSPQGSRFSELSLVLIGLGFQQESGNVTYYVDNQAYVSFCDSYIVYVYGRKKGVSTCQEFPLGKRNVLELLKLIRQNSLLKLKY